MIVNTTNPEDYTKVTTNRNTLAQVLKSMPPSFFKPVGQRFIDHYNRKYNLQWGPEWAGQCFATFLYTACGSLTNYRHPFFDRTAPPQLQVKY